MTEQQTKEAPWVQELHHEFSTPLEKEFEAAKVELRAAVNAKPDYANSFAICRSKSASTLRYIKSRMEEDGLIVNYFNDGHAYLSVTVRTPEKYRSSLPACSNDDI
jgi:histidinol-phosphate/aromatic aminotransferase/cobyric acid decarboxylase-like protein